jgi:hypothetical protein
MNKESQIRAMLKVMSKGIYEKEHILAMTLLCAIAGESIFLLGPPGTAKSLVARRLKLAFSNANAFEYLMSRFSTPDEIFGPVSISLLKNEDRYERVVNGFLPTATVVFLDEIWKAGPSIQNALLTAINERIFQNGRSTLSLPMKVLIAASNELPMEDEGLEALWDRFLVRMVSNCIQTESVFFKMIRQKPVKDITMPKELEITDDTYESWQQEIHAVAIPDNVCAVVTTIRKRLREEALKDGNKDMDFYVSDRRWKKCFHIMQTAAFLNGRNNIDLTDIPILFHCLWNTAEVIPSIIDIVANSLTGEIDKKIDKIQKEIDIAIKMKSQPAKKEEDFRNMPEHFTLVSYFYYSICNFPHGKCLFYKADYNHVDANNVSDGILYRDDQKRSWIIRAIYTGTPFDYKVRNVQNVKKIKLQKCYGGIIIDNTPYAFERANPLSVLISNSLGNSQELFGNSFFTEPTVADNALSLLQKEIVPGLKKIQRLFAHTKHLFLSDDDKKVVKKYLDQCDIRTKELEVVIKNAQQLL